MNSIITNRVFYKLDDEEDKSILNEMNKKDGKVILVLNSLYYFTNRLGVANTTVKKILDFCNYSDINKNIISFKNILYKLKELDIIYFKETIIDKNTLLEINTYNLVENDEGYFNFFKLGEDEIELIRSNTTNNQNFITQLKVYCYLKARVKKIDESKSITERGMGESETTWRSYNDITKHTGVSSVEKSINNLREIGLIKYINPGIKIDNNNKRTKCNNIYVLTRVSKNPDEELKEGLKQYLYYEQQQKNKVIQM